MNTIITSTIIIIPSNAIISYAGINITLTSQVNLESVNISRALKQWNEGENTGTASTGEATWNWSRLNEEAWTENGAKGFDDSEDGFIWNVTETASLCSQKVLTQLLFTKPSVALTLA